MPRIILSPKELIEKSLVSEVRRGRRKLPSRREVALRYGIGRTQADTILNKIANNYPAMITSKSGKFYYQEPVSGHPAINVLLDEGYSLEQIQRLVIDELARRSQTTITIIGDESSAALIQTELQSGFLLGVNGIRVGVAGTEEIEIALKLSDHSSLIGSIYRQSPNAIIGIVSNCYDFIDQVIGAMAVWRQNDVFISSTKNTQECYRVFSACTAIIADQLSTPVLQKLARAYPLSVPKIHCANHISVQSIEELKNRLNK